MKNLFLIILMSFTTLNVFADNKVRRFEIQVQKACPEIKISKLLLKKSLIELIRGQECSAKFTTLLIGQCAELNCDFISDVYKEIEQVRAGAVIGDE